MAGNGRPTYHPDLVGKIADMFRDGSSITKVAAVKLGVVRNTYYEWKANYPDFKAEAERGEQLSQAFHEDKLEATADGEIEKANGACRIFIMKNRFRECYADKPDDSKSASDTLIEKLLEKL
jgi:transposase